ncbi:hypothetical protein [Aliarcobacter cryaerophilus]|nr:hypothetical protein [Aliarcobacter cryaerophilus]
MKIVIEYKEQKEDIKLLNKVFNFILIFLTTVIIVLTLKSIYDDYKNISIIDLIKKFFLPFLLTLFYLPFYYILIIIFKYETIFILIDLHQKNRWLNVYTKIKIILTCFMSYNKLKKIDLRVFFISKLNSRNEIKETIKYIVSNKSDNENLKK